MSPLLGRPVPSRSSSAAFRVGPASCLSSRSSVSSALLVANCHGSDKKKVTPSTVPTTDTKGKPNVSLALKLGSLSVLAADTAKPFDPATAKQILKLVNDYIADSMTKPLFTGARCAGRRGLLRTEPPFADQAEEPRSRRAHRRERARRSPASRRRSRSRSRSPASSRAGRLLMIGAQLAVSVKGETDDGPLAISRVGYLVFEPDSKHHVAHHRLHARRAARHRYHLDDAEGHDHDGGQMRARAASLRFLRSRLFSATGRSGTGPCGCCARR